MSAPSIAAVLYPAPSRRSLAQSASLAMVSALVCFSLVLPVVTISDSLPWLKVEQVLLPFVGRPLYMDAFYGLGAGDSLQRDVRHRRGLYVIDRGFHLVRRGNLAASDSRSRLLRNSESVAAGNLLHDWPGIRTRRTLTSPLVVLVQRDDRGDLRLRVGAIFAARLHLSLKCAVFRRRAHRQRAAGARPRVLDDGAMRMCSAS